MLRYAFVLMLSGSLAWSAEVAFSTPPSAKKDGDKVAVAFAISAKSDVEVAILDAKGEPVRHLAAGVLGGEKAPPEPLKAGLSQSLTWDGKDDFGNPAVGGPFKVRVRASMGGTFGRFIGEDPYTFGALTSIATDEDGRLYITANPGSLNQNVEGLRVFSPEGEYIRTLIPFSADLKPDRVSGIAAWNETLKSYVPKNTRSQLPEFYPWGVGARLVSASVKNGLVLVHGTNTFRMDADGGNIRGPFPMWSAAAKLKNPAWNIPQIACSPDGGLLYYANVAGTQYSPKHFKDTDPNWPQGRVYRQNAGKTGSDPETFFDLNLPDWETNKYWLPNAWNCRTAAYSIACDAQGRLLIGDLVNQQIVEVSPDGKKVSETKVAWPEKVMADSRTGALFVLSRKTPLPNESSELTLVKIEGRGPSAKKTAELPLNVGVNRAGLGAALGQIGGQPVVWIASSKGLLCVKDSGSKLEIVASKFAPRAEAQCDWNRIAADYKRDEIYTSDGGNLIYRYDGKTGAGGILKKNGKPFNGVDLAIGYDGLVYFRAGIGYSGPLERYDHELNPAPFPNGTHVICASIYSRYGVGNCEKGLGVGPRGECYINFMYGWNKYFVAGFGPDGKAIHGKYLLGKIGNQAQEKKEMKVYPPELDSAVIGPLTAECGGIRVDLQGNIYVGLRLKSKNFAAPAGLDKDAAYNTFTGSIVKFPPGGGSVLNAVKEDNQAVEGTPLDAQNGLQLVHALKIYDGCGPYSGGGFGGGGSCCVCRVPRFDLDRYGRLIYPNAVTNRITLVDNAGNSILELGAYGNFDSQYIPPSSKESKPAVAMPEIPIAWATGAALTQNYIFVNDTYNRRAVRVDLKYKAETVCEIK